MPELKINRLTNANLYVDGVGYLGQAKEIEMPNLEHKMEEHSGLGMVGMIETFSGIEKMEMKISWNCVYQEALLAVANPQSVKQIQIRGSIDQITAAAGINAQVPYVCHVSAVAKGVNLGNFAQHQNNEVETPFAVYRIKLEVNGQSIFEFDPTANIYTINGEDILATYRSNIGA